MEIQWYKCTLNPMEKFFFGGEQDYYTRSEKKPSQTTLLGVIRYLLLKNHNLLNPKEKVGGNMSEKQKSLIGSNGFFIDYSGSIESNSYGKILEISPLFLSDKTKCWIKTPYNQNSKAGNKYQPIRMHVLNRGCTECSHALLPDEEEYNAMEGHVNSYCTTLGVPWEELSDDDIWGKTKQPGIPVDLDEKGCLHREYLFLRNFAFCFYVKMNGDNFLPYADVVYMGQKKSLFQFTSVKIDEKDVWYAEESHFKSLFDGEYHNIDDYHIFYCLSDLLCEHKLPVDFSITGKRYFRCMTASGDVKNGYIKTRKISRLFQMYDAGSVFYVHKENETEFVNLIKSESLEIIGYNKVIRIKGE